MSNFNVAVLISGNGSNLQAIINKFQKDESVNVSCVVSNKKDAYGLVRAEKAKIDNYFIDNKNFSSREQFEQAVINILDKYEPDLVVLAGFMRILSELFVNKYENKLINIHPSLLPNYGGKGMYGLNVHQEVLNNKEIETGVTIHYINEKYDEGKIIFQAKCNISDCKTAKLISRKVQKLEHQFYPIIIEKILKDGN